MRMKIATSQMTNFGCMVWAVELKQGISVEEASGHIQAATPVLGWETVALGDALGRVVAESMISTRELPPADCSAMDGYAVHSADLVDATDAEPVDLSVVEEIPAGGTSEQRLQPGTSARIFTGAPVPKGADAVVRQEDAHVGQEGRVMIRVAVPPQENVREAGEDVRLGDCVMDSGQYVGAAEVGMMASLGRSMVRVHKRPRVAILSGGDELVEVDGEVKGGRIVASNSYTLMAACKMLGADPFYLGISSDDPESVEDQFRQALQADCIVSSAGVSVGDHDHVRPVLEKLGCRLDFWGVRMKPGYPLAFGRFQSERDSLNDAGPLVFGLPGNPVSAFVSFEIFVRPALLRMMGRTRCFRRTLRVRLAETFRKKAGRMHFVRVKLSESSGIIEAKSTGNQSSGVLSSMTRADALLVFPEEATEMSAGAEALVQLLNDDPYSEKGLGF
ncbi:MAG: molybdenum cofactor biosynthesis protein [Deltaproteobacteria bacterium]|nr:molybdenum cofactor biosynthesis protein [Deltaproteobacteria bacterium]